MIVVRWFGGYSSYELVVLMGRRFVGWCYELDGVVGMSALMVVRWVVVIPVMSYKLT